MKRTKQDREKKLHMDRQLLLKLEMAVIVVVSVIAVTIAWFCLMNYAWAKNLTLKAGSADYIKVALEPGGKDVSELDEDQRYIDINMPNFYNVEKNDGKTLMAPGVSGELHLYITSLHPDVTECYINAECVPLFESENTEGTGESQNPGLTEEQQALEKLVKGHIQFYSNYDETNKTYSGLIGEEEYTGSLNGTDPLNATLTIDELQQGVEKSITIYWIWFYEYTDIPDEGKGREDPGYYFDYNGAASDLSEDEKLLYYDYGDTKIGRKVPEVKLHIVVDALDESVSETGENN